MNGSYGVCMGKSETRILAIDDNSDNLITLKALLHDAFPEIEVLTALDGPQGLELAAVQEPDVILLDIIMPGMDGFDVCRRLKSKEETNEIPVVFVTAIKGDKENRIRALECGAEAFLTKPVDESELTAQIRAMLKIRTANILKHDEKKRLAILIREKTTELEESEERFRTLSETSLIGVGVSSDADVILYTNHSYEQILGYKHAELIGTKAVDLYWNPEDRLTWKDKMQEDGLLRDFEVRLKRKDGLPVWVSISVSPIMFGRLKAIMSTIQDISARKKAEDELKVYASELEISNKELEAFAFSLSHDLRAPLRALDGFSQAVLEDYGDLLDSTGKDYLLRIRSAAQNMDQITIGMLKLSEVIRNELRWEPVCLSDTVTLILEELRKKEPEREIEFDIEQNIYVMGDHSLLYVALYNLLENAWKFTAKSPNGKIEFTSIDSGTTKVYLVKDNGIGFEMQYSDKLFHPFQRLHTDNDFPGNGIGLATVQRVIRRHGGRIWADSEIGKGTTFYFTLGDFGM